MIFGTVGCLQFPPKTKHLSLPCSIKNGTTVPPIPTAKCQDMWVNGSRPPTGKTYEIAGIGIPVLRISTILLYNTYLFAGIKKSIVKNMSCCRLQQQQLCNLRQAESQLCNLRQAESQRFPFKNKTGHGTHGQNHMFELTTNRVKHAERHVSPKHPKILREPWRDEEIWQLASETDTWSFGWWEKTTGS